MQTAFVTSSSMTGLVGLHTLSSSGVEFKQSLARNLVIAKQSQVCQVSHSPTDSKKIILHSPPRLMVFLYFALPSTGELTNTVSVVISEPMTRSEVRVALI